MVLLYIAAGINHFIHPEMYLKIMPLWVPAHGLLVSISGWVEVILGALLLVRPLRQAAAIGIILLLIAVFPANVQMMLNFQKEHSSLLWLAILRLPLQGLLIWWAWQYAKSHTHTNAAQRV